MFYSNKKPCKIFNDLDFLSIGTCTDWFGKASGMLAPKNFRVKLKTYSDVVRFLFVGFHPGLFFFALMVKHLIMKEQQDLEELLSQN